MSRTLTGGLTDNSKALEAVAQCFNFDQGLDFGYCCVGKAYTKTITLVNPCSTGSAVKFSLNSTESCFSVTPKQGTVGPRQKKEITFTFECSDAKVMLATMAVTVTQGDVERSRMLKMSAMSKFPFITANKSQINFEQLLIGKTDSQIVTVKNSSLVTAMIRVQKVTDDDKDQSFTLNFTEGELEPQCELKIEVKYLPTVAGNTSCTYYKITSDCGNELGLSVKGEAKGVDVMLSANSIHFGEVAIDNSTNRLLNVQNNNDMPLTFQFVTDKNNMFSFSETEGVVKPFSFARIIITFTPPKTGNFYERCFCMVRNHQVMYVDMIGTCFDILTKPVPLMQRHIDAYRHKVIMGNHKKTALKADESYIMDERLHTVGSTGLNTGGADMEMPIDDQSQVVLHKEMLHSAQAQTRDVRFNIDSIDFGFTHHGRMSEGRTVTLQNTYSFPVKVSWHLMKVIDKKTGKFISNPFQVKPDEFEMSPNSSQTFECGFCPNEPDSYFFQIAQCFITLLNGNNGKTKKLAASITGGNKTMAGTKGKTLLGSMKKNLFADFSNEDVDPPIAMNVRMSGHSFAPGSQPFIPMVKLSQTKLQFSPCSPGESVFSTVMVYNNSDTPSLYKAMQDSTGTFKAFPSVGSIAGKSFAIICLEFSPKSARTFNFNSQFVFNNSTANIQSVQLQGTCYGPSLSLPIDTLFYSPTYVGVSTKQKFVVKNDARIPIEYEWRVPEKYRNEVIVQPASSLLLPNEEANIACTFTPLKKKQYNVSIPIFARNQFDKAKNFVGFYNPGSGLSLTTGGTDIPGAVGGVTTIRKEINIIGGGSDGQMEINPKSLDFGTITVGFNKTLQVVVTNKSSCNLYVELKMIPIGTENMSPDEAHRINQVLADCFKFDSQKGLVNALSKKKINLTFKPTQRFEFATQLVCIGREKMTKELNQSVKISQKNGTVNTPGAVEKASIKIHCKGDYPLVRVTDVRNDQVSIANLWERFELTAMNKQLLTPLSQAEYTYNNSDKSNQSTEELTANLNRFHWDFGKIPTKRGKDPRKITVTLKNIGGVQAAWRFKMPNDSEIEMEPWVDAGTPSPEQAFEQQVLAQQIFQVEPRNGVLEPGEQMDLQVMYYPKEVMKHHLNTFFEVRNGKPLIVQLQGETLSRRACLQLLKHTYQMPPVPIGMELPITYPIEIKNLGITKLKYSIDLSQLEELNHRNFDFRVFDIQNPNGDLKTNETQHIYTLFKPLEAKTYELDLPIRVEDIEGTQKDPIMLRLRGRGYSPAQAQKIQEEAFYEDLPLCRANLNENGSMAAFSMESIDFGELESNEPARRFVILYNMHPTQRCKFDFQKTGLMCGDNLRLEPLSGDLKPGAHCNIKMTLIPSRFPTHFEGEIQCSIDWDRDTGDKLETRSMQTMTVANDSLEYLFLRLKKRSKITKVQLGTDTRENEHLTENILHEAIHDILESDEFDQMLDSCHESKAALYNSAVTDQPRPTKEFLKGEAAEDEEEEYVQPEYESIQPQYENQLREVSAVDDGELFRKRMFMKEPFAELMEFMLEDTCFNLMEEATYEEFDLTQPPKIYIRKN